MNARLTILLSLSAVAPAFAQSGGGLDLSWWTIDGGGGVSTGGTLSLSMTIGQAEAGACAGGTFALTGGFWAGVGAAPCYPNCDNSTVPPILNVQDFACFLNKFAAADPYANCDASTTPPVLNVQDFACFLNRFASGCQ